MIRTDKLSEWIAGLTQADAAMLRAALELAAANSALLLAVDTAEPTVLRRLGRDPTELPGEVKQAIEWIGLWLNALRDERTG